METLTPSETETLKMFDEKFITDDGDFSWVANDVEGTTIRDFLLTQLRLARAEKTAPLATYDEVREQAYEYGKNAAVDYVRGEFAKVTQTDEDENYCIHPLELREILEEARKANY